MCWWAVPIGVAQFFLGRCVLSGAVDFVVDVMFRVVVVLCVCIILIYRTVWCGIRLLFFWTLDPRVVVRDYFREVMEWLDITVQIS